MTSKTKIQFGAIVILVICALALIFSQSASPDNPTLFALKRVQEKVYLKYSTNKADRVDYLSALLNKRLEELSSQVKRQSYSHILPSASRYSSLAGEITEMIIDSNMKDKVATIKSQFNNHLKILQEIYVIYPKNTENMEYKYIEDDINYLKLYLDKLSNFFNAEKA